MTRPDRTRPILIAAVSFALAVAGVGVAGALALSGRRRHGQDHGQCLRPQDGDGHSRQRRDLDEYRVQGAHRDRRRRQLRQRRCRTGRGLRQPLRHGRDVRLPRHPRRGDQGLGDRESRGTHADPEWDAEADAAARHPSARFQVPRAGRDRGAIGITNPVASATGAGAAAGDSAPLIIGILVVAVIAAVAIYTYWRRRRE